MLPDPQHELPETVTGLPSEYTVKRLWMVELFRPRSVSLNVMVSTEPLELSTAERRVGGPTVELFVTAVAARDAASFPAESCTAAFEAAEFGVGAEYATVTVELPETADESVRTTVLPDTDLLLTVAATPSTRTVKSVVAAVVEDSVSL